MHPKLLRQALALAASLFALGSSAQSSTTASSSASCPTVLSPSYPAPVVGGGYTAQLIVTGLTSPRGILFDNKGALLVVEQGSGVMHITFTDNGGTCLFVEKTTNLISDKSLTHGIEISSDGKTLYASSSNEVFSWAYDAAAVSVTDKRTLIQNMSNSDHVTRTLLLSQKQPDLLLVSRGSGENIDELAAQMNSGVSQIRAFNISNMTSGQIYDYPSEGKRLGWGLRNSVGVAEEPNTGGIYSVENSADQISRDGTDIHQDDPGEEMNFHGFLNGSTESQGGNYGYPDCFALWGTDIPNVGSMKVGDQFSLTQSTTLNDSLCASNYVAPRLTFQAHTAPLDMKFAANGSLAYVTFHGSWNRDDPVGYKLSVLSFAKGEPTEPSDSTKAAIDVLSNPDTKQCPGNCFRPVGLAIDGQNRVFMSSDSTGEVYVIQQVDMSATGTPSASGSGTGTLVTSTSSSSPNAAPHLHAPRNEEWLVVLTLALSVVGGVFFMAV